MLREVEAHRPAVPRAGCRRLADVPDARGAWRCGGGAAERRVAAWESGREAVERRRGVAGLAALVRALMRESEI
jgi:hypothetical protein